MITNLSTIKYYKNILETIGNTPLVKLNKVTDGIKATILAKVESFNPGGSVKDRIALDIIEDAEAKGLLKPGGTIVESTSGNTGVGLAIASAVKGYKTIFTMPDKMSQEKIRLLKALGAEVIVTPTAVPADSPESYYEVAKRVVKETPNSVLANQYFNPKNPEAHYKTTGPEIWEQTAGQIDYFVAGIGTGGTISGVGKFLKEKNPKIKVIGTDPKGSVIREYFYTRRKPQAFKTYKVEGIGEDIIPGTVYFEYIDEIIEVDDKESFLLARRLTREEGIFVGGSAGSALAGALRIAKNLDENQLIVVLFPDTGERYLSKFYSDEWMKEHGFLESDKISLRNILDGKSSAVQQLIYITPIDTVAKAIDLMREHNVSQLPVLEGGRSIGSVTDGTLMSAVLENPSLLDSLISKVMDKSFPTLNIKDNISLAIDLLAKRNDAVLVEEEGRIVGIVTRYDLVEYLAP